MNSDPYPRDNELGVRSANDCLWCQADVPRPPQHDCIADALGCLDHGASGRGTQGSQLSGSRRGASGQVPWHDEVHKPSRASIYLGPVVGLKIDDGDSASWKLLRNEGHAGIGAATSQKNCQVF